MHIIYQKVIYIHIISLHIEGPIKDPPKTPRYHTLVVFEGFGWCPQLYKHDCRETPASRTDVRLIVVTFPMWQQDKNRKKAREESERKSSRVHRGR